MDDGAPVTGAASQRSRLALLALLAAAGPAGVAREKLLACLWPESDDERARHALKQSVYALRRDLGNENAIAGTATLTLDPTLVASDIREFEEALARGDDVAAVSLYAGPFLDGVFVKAAPEFDQWAASERSRLERAHLEAIARLARAADASGDSITSVQWWRRAAAAEPLSGRVALSLMRALAESGDVSAAIQHARVHDAMVRDQLDSPADDAVLAFAEELRSGHWTPTPRTSAATKAGTAVTESVAQEAPPAAEPRASGPVRTSTPVRASAPVRTRVKAARRRAPWIIAAIAIIAIAVGAAIAPDTRARIVGMFGKPPGPPSSRRIVVAPFTNHTGDKSLDSYGELAADWLARVLLEADFEVVDSRTSSLASRTIARTAVTGTAYDRAAALAAQTGAATVVTGSYYRQGDTLQFEANVLDPARQVTLHAVGPMFGPMSQASTVLAKLANRVTASMAASTDTTAGARTAALIEPPSVQAFEHASRAWEMFFTRPADTAAVFAELARASAIDSAYTGPLLMRAYVLDVKERWSDLAEAVAKLEPHRARMGRIEREALALFESDLRGDLLGRLRASHELMRLSPGSVDMVLLVAISSSYLNRPAEAYAALSGSSPDRGINVLTPMYWAWRAEAEHSLGRYDAERVSATEMAARFPAQLYGKQALARSQAARGDTAALNALLRTSGMNAPTPGANARTVALIAARELRAHGKPREAAAIFARVAAVTPARDASRDERSKYALALYEVGDYAKSKSAFTALLASDTNDMDALGRLGTIAARTGDSASVRSIEQRLAAWSGKYALGRPTYWRAHIAVLTGRGSEAVSLLHSAFAQGYRPMDLNIVTLHEDPDFLPMANDPAFRDLVRPRDGPPVLP
ncbi:MAG: transcriptional activator protein [Gemmatimonadetes bacterium]|nr:transcriptional activator protein [Gemmatimonadota bacterium]